MKNKILLLFLYICVGFIFSGCKTQTTNSTLTSTESENSKKITNSANKDISVPKKKLIKKQKKKEIWEDAKSSSVESIIKTYRWKSLDYDSYTNFNDFISSFEKIYNDNKFAKNLVDKSRNVSYNEWDINTQLVFDTYIKLLFVKDDEIYKYDSLGNIEEAWYSYYEPSNESFYHMRFTNFPKATNDYVEIERRDSNGKMSAHIYDTYNSIRENGTVEVLPDTIDFIDISVSDIGVNGLNEIISSNKDFLDFLVKYRNDIYSDVVKKEMDAEAAIDEKKDKLSKMTPQIGMSSSDVIFTEWGYPDDINKDTYAWGTEEQWVYDGKGYVYFENGIVTSVSER